jgi:ferric-dicitrate binding protein FerR (iron transport regulator)
METTDWPMLASYFSGELSPQQEQELLEWVNINPEHQLAFAHAKQLWQVTEPMPLVPNPDTEGEWASFQQKIETPGRTLGKQSGGYYGWAAAAAVVVLLGIGFAFWLRNPTQTFPTVATTDISHTSSFTRFTTTDSVRVVYLPDSSRVWLNQHSELSYFPSFGQPERRVSLQGEAFFEVRPDASHPFVVRMAKAQVRVLGTTFDVKAYPGKPTEVSVVSGKVAFYEGIDTLHKSVILYANEGATFGQNVPTISKTKSPAQSRLVWRQRNNPTYQQEVRRPGRFLAVTSNWRKNGLRQTIIEGAIQNNATLASYASITLRYTVFTKQGKQKSNEFTIRETIRPGQTLLYKRSLLDVLSKPTLVSVEVSEAESESHK